MARPQLIKILKLLSFILGGAVAVAALLAVTASLLFDAEAVKAQAARLMLEKKQRILRIEGEAALSFWPSVGLRLAKVSLSEHDSERVFAAAEKVRLSLRLLPLLRKELAVDTVELDGIAINLIRHKDGSFNYDDLISQEKDKEPLRFDVAGVRLSHGSLGYVDEGAGRTIRVSELDLGSGRLANVAEGKLTLSGKLSVDKPALAGDAKLIGHYRLNLDQRTYALDGLDIRSVGDYLGMKGAELALAADLLSVKPAGVEAIKLELGAKGKWPDQALEVRLSVPKLVLGGDRGASEALSLTVAATGPGGKSGARAEFSGIALEGSQLRAAKFSLAADSRQAESGVRLNLSSPFSADLGTQVFKLPQITGEAELSHPALAVKPLIMALTGALEADPARPFLGLALNAANASTRLASKVQLSRFSPPAIAFSLDVDRLDADKYLLPAKAPAAGAKTVARPLDFSFLNALDVSGTVKVGSLQYAGVKASGLRVDLRAKDGRLEVSPLAASLYQGSVSGSVTLDAQGNRVAVRQNFSGVAVAPLLKDALHKEFLEGHGNLALDIHTAGGDVPAMTQGLAGTARVDLKDGAVKGINIAKSLRDLKSRLIQRQDMVQAANAADKTDFTELSASFDIEKGIARNKDFSAKSPFLRVAGAGQFDLPRETMDYTAKVAVVPTAAGQTGKDLADLNGLTIPIRLSGPFQAPSYRLAFADVVSDLVAGKAAAKADELKKQAKEEAQKKLGGALKGLLGR
ncbi:MAG: AsmA family protein [Rhodocyclaceae bacterium]|nr:AsmA family protein [Rhodocyclaceae bacterium]